MAYTISVSPGLPGQSIYWLRLRGNVSVHELWLYQNHKRSTPRHSLALKMSDLSVIILESIIDGENSPPKLTLSFRNTQNSPPAHMVRLDFSKNPVELAFILAVSHVYEISQFQNAAKQPTLQQFSELFPFVLTAVVAKKCVPIIKLPDNLIHDPCLSSVWREVYSSTSHDLLFWESSAAKYMKKTLRALTRSAVAETIRVNMNQANAHRFVGSDEEKKLFVDSTVAWIEALAKNPVSTRSERWHQLWTTSWDSQAMSRVSSGAHSLSEHIPTRVQYLVVGISDQKANVPSSTDVFRSGALGNFQPEVIQAITEDNSGNSEAIKKLNQRFAGWSRQNTSEQASTWLTALELGEEMAWINGWKKGSEARASTKPENVKIPAEAIADRDNLLDKLWSSLNLDDELTKWADNTWSTVENKRLRWLGKRFPERKTHLQTTFLSTWKDKWENTWKTAWTDSWDVSWKNAYEKGCIMREKDAGSQPASARDKILRALQDLSYTDSIHRLVSMLKTLSEMNPMLHDPKLGGPQGLKIMLSSKVSSKRKAKPPPLPSHAQLQNHVIEQINQAFEPPKSISTKYLNTVRYKLVMPIRKPRTANLGDFTGMIAKTWQLALEEEKKLKKEMGIAATSQRKMTVFSSRVPYCWPML